MGGLSKICAVASSDRHSYMAAMADLERFVKAQAHLYDQALAELRRGRKTSHWMWFVFPQIAGLGRSEMATFYAISDAAEARDYLAHPVLGARLAECVQTLLNHAGDRSAAQILGDLDALKLRSSLTLFEAVDSNPLWATCLDAFYDGKRDPETLNRL
jgi:uncharacterized protein (DUF1810 family)